MHTMALYKVLVKFLLTFKHRLFVTRSLKCQCANSCEHNILHIVGCFLFLFTFLCDCLTPYLDNAFVSLHNSFHLEQIYILPLILNNQLKMSKSVKISNFQKLGR